MPETTPKMPANNGVVYRPAIVLNDASKSAVGGFSRAQMAKVQSLMKYSWERNERKRSIVTTESMYKRAIYGMGHAGQCILTCTPFNKCVSSIIRHRFLWFLSLDMLRGVAVTLLLALHLPLTSSVNC